MDFIHVAASNTANDEVKQLGHMQSI